MSGGTNFALTTSSPSPVADRYVGGTLHTTLPEISTDALPGDGSYGDPITGFRQINQQMADTQRAFSDATAHRSNEINAGFAAQNAARNADQRAQLNETAALSQALRAPLNQPPVTGPILPPNFAETARMPGDPAFGLDGPVAPAGFQAARQPETSAPAQATPRTPVTTENVQDGLLRDRLLTAAMLPAGIGIGLFRRGIENSQAMLDAATSGFTLPRDVMNGTVDPTSEEGIRRTLDMAGLAMTGSIGGVPMGINEVVLGSGPTGRLGNPIQIAGTQNVRTVINGREFSGHALDQMQGRGFVPSVIENTIQQGTIFPTRGGTIGYYDAENRVRVITDAATGRVVTVIPGAP